jgi:beta-1,4-mannosyltransferase
VSARPVAVVVLGEIARSPRMRNHAVELARHGHAVSLIGFGAWLDTRPGITVRSLRAWPRAPEKSTRLVFLMWSAARMTLILASLTMRLIRERPHSILIQNPPSFPGLAAAWIAAKWVRAEWMVDWHNYGFTILALRLGASHRLVSLARSYEFAVARHAKAHLCVSASMRDDLKQHGILARTLYDRTVERAKPASAGTQITIVCPLGWTADDDVALLLDALSTLDPPRDFEIHLTGDGPLRAQFAPRIAAFSRPGIEIHSRDLPETEYRALLLRATIGVSLHRSTSGLDLAMKVSDLFANCVPVCAFDYGGALSEQIEDGVTGFLFRDSAGLAAVLHRVLREPAILHPMRHSIEARSTETWPEAWQREASGWFGGAR